jgi:hypothetical protein
VTFDFLGERLSGKGTLRATPSGALLSLSGSTSPGTSISSLTFDSSFAEGQWDGEHYVVKRSSTDVRDPVLGVGVANVLLAVALPPVSEQDGGEPAKDPFANAPPPPPPSSSNFERENPLSDVIQLRIVSLDISIDKAGVVGGSIGWVDDRSLDYVNGGPFPQSPQLLVLGGRLGIHCAQPGEAGAVAYWTGPFDSPGRCDSTLGGFGN